MNKMASSSVESTRLGLSGFFIFGAKAPPEGLTAFRTVTAAVGLRMPLFRVPPLEGVNARSSDPFGAAERARQARRRRRERF